MTVILAKLQETTPSIPVSNAMTFTYPPGSTPLPRYTIRRGIGIGGFGEVYFAISEAGKEVALKRIQRNLDVELRGVSHCLNLKHPNLVSLYDICRDPNDESWVVMEYVAGKNLRQVLDESPSGLAETEVRRWMAAVCAGVHHLHSAGLVHRDLKPGNVFDDLGIVKVGDYGLSKFISSSHRTGHTESVGTFHYMAPEIGRGEYGREIDIYALGIMLYEMMTGMVPFDGESSHEIIIKHMTAQPNLTLVAEPYRSVIAKCLEKDPKNRFRSTTDLTAALLLGSPERPAMAGSSDYEPVDGVPYAENPYAENPYAENPYAELEEPIIAELASPPPRAQASGVSENKESDLKRWWCALDQSPGAKAFLVLGIVFAMMTHSRWLLPLVMMAAIVYVPYYIVRQLVLHVTKQPSYAKAQSQASLGPQPTPRPLSKSEWRRRCRTQLCAKPTIERIAELSTSWLTALLTTFVLMLVTAVIGLGHGPTDAIAVAPYAAMAVIVLVSAFAILGLAKFWERDEGESLPRRLVLSGVGALVGAVAYAIARFLMLPLDQGLTREIDSTLLPQALYLANEIPRASAVMVHFAFLFAALRWWKPVDPLRRRRLSLWSVAVAVVAEWAIHQMLPIPQPVGMLIAGGIAIVIQLSSPWINSCKRLPLRKAAAAGAAAMLVVSTFSVPLQAASADTEPVADAISEAKNEEVKNTESVELSVAPLDQISYPAGRPDWIDEVYDIDNSGSNGTYIVVVVSTPSETSEESIANLWLMKRAAVRNTLMELSQSPHDFAACPLDDDWIDEWLVKRTYEGEVTQGDMQFYEHAAELVFDKAARDEIAKLTKRAELQNRLGLLSVAGVGGFCLLVASSFATSYLSRRRSVIAR